MALGCSALAIAARSSTQGPSPVSLPRDIAVRTPSARQLLPDPQRGVPGEGVLGIAVVGRGAAGLAVLGAAAAGGHLPADRGVVGAVVAGVEEDDHARDVGGRGRCGAGERRRGDEQAGGERSADTQAGWHVHGVKVARGRLGLKGQTAACWTSATKSRPIRKGTVMQPGGTARHVGTPRAGAADAAAADGGAGSAGQRRGARAGRRRPGAGHHEGQRRGGGGVDRPEGRRPRTMSRRCRTSSSARIADASKQVTILAQDRLGPLAGGMGDLGLPGL